MAKKIESKYLWYLTAQILLLMVAIASISVSLYYLFTQYVDFFNSTDTSIFWMGYLLIACAIIASGIFLLAVALIIKALFYIKMGYKYDPNEAKVAAGEGAIHD